MKCPLMVAGYRDRTLDPLRPATDCLKGECAWWDKDNEQCAVLTIARGMFIFNKQMIDLVGKMPHEVQFRK